jgi:hypothetical protein
MTRSVFFLARIGLALGAALVSDSEESVYHIASRIIELTTADENLILLGDSIAVLYDIMASARSTTALSASISWDETNSYYSDEISRLEYQIREQLQTSAEQSVLINHSVPSSVIDSVYMKILEDCLDCSKPELLQLSLVTEIIPTIPTKIFTRGLVILPASFLPIRAFRAVSLDDPGKAVETVAKRVVDGISSLEKLVFIDASLRSVDEVISRSRSTTVVSSSPTAATVSSWIEELIGQVQSLARMSYVVMVNHKIPPEFVDLLYSNLMKKCPWCSGKVCLLQLVSEEGTIPATSNQTPVRGLIYLPEAFTGKSGGEFPDALPTFRNSRYSGSIKLADPESARITAGKLNAYWVESQMINLILSASNAFVVNGLASMMIDKLLSIPCGDRCEQFGRWMDMHLFDDNIDWLFVYHIHDIKRLIKYIPHNKVITAATALLRTDFNRAERSTEDIFPTVVSVSKQILHATSNDELLVFVGNSPSYFYHLVREFRDCVALPFSTSRFNLANFNFDRDTFPGLDHFVEVLLRPIFDKKKPIVLIDMSVSGRTINILNRLMKSRCRECKIQYLQLFIENSTVFSLPQSPREVDTRAIIFIPEICSNFSYNLFHRLMPKLSREHWSKASQGLMHAYKAQPEQAAVIAHIEALAYSAEMRTPLPSERPSPVINLGLFARLAGDHEGHPTTWLAPNLSIPLIRVTDWLKQRLYKYSMTLHSEVITRLDVDQMTKAQSSRGESVEQVAQRLIRMCDFAYSRGWFSKWGPQLMELIHNHAFIKQELGPIATQIAHAIQVPPESRGKFNQVLGISD